MLAKIYLARHQIDEYPYQFDAVSGSEGNDVGARDDTLAGRLEPGFRAVDDVESFEARIVDQRVFLRVVSGRGVQENRPVATLNSKNNRL